MSKTDVKDFAKTKHKGLPVKKEVDENRYSPLQMAKAKKEREDRRKKDGESDSRYQRIMKKQYGGMMGGLKKEETELDEAFTPKEIKMAIGVASDKRYAGGNMTGAVNAIEKIKKGLSDHPQVKAVLRRQNESVEMIEAAPKLKGNDGPYTRQQIEKAAKEAKVDIGAKARMMMALRKV